MNMVYTQETWLKAYHELISVMLEFGIPEEVSKYIAENLHSERSIRRMISYMHNAHPTRMEDIADEMYAIMEDRNNWIQKKENEGSNATYNAWLNSETRRNNLRENE